jgi:DNA-binding MarR family transcriptional regulator
MSQEPTLTGQDIGQAEKATRAVLDGLLADANTRFHEWVAIRLIAKSGGSLDHTDVVNQMVHGLKITAGDATSTLAALEAADLVRTDAASVVLTSSGSAVFDQINAGVQQVTEHIYGDIPVADLVTARRVLAIVTERANAILAAHAS